MQSICYVSVGAESSMSVPAALDQAVSLKPRGFGFLRSFCKLTAACNSPHTRVCFSHSAVFCSGGRQHGVLHGGDSGVM